MLKTLSIAGMASILLAGSAAAADLPRRAAPPVFTAVPVFTWTGFYIGVNAGYAWSDKDTVRSFGNDAVTRSQFAAGTAVPSFRLHQTGVSAGGQAGYNYQFLGSGLVVGVEADAAYTDLRRNATFAGAFQVNSNYSQKLEYLGTVRGRLGFAFDRVLIYGTGGYAYGETQFGQTINAGNANNAVIWGGGRSGMQTGYAAGGGIEYALPTTLSLFNASAVMLKVEYLHYDLGTRSVNLVGGLGAPFSFTDRFRTSGNVVRAGLNLKFGS